MNFYSIIDIALTSGGVAVLTILIRGNGQKMGDIAAVTTIICEKQIVFMKDTVMTEISLNYVPIYSQVTLFKGSEMQTIKNLYDMAVGQ